MRRLAFLLAWTWVPGLLGLEVAPGEVLNFRDPHPSAYRLETGPSVVPATAPEGDWIRASSPPGGRTVWLGDQVVLQVAAPGNLGNLLADLPLAVTEVLESNVFLLQAPDARTAVRAAASLAADPRVRVSHPVRQQAVKLHGGGFASRPNDPLFPKQWHLENRDVETGVRNGYDLNLRAAWALSQGLGVTIAQGDDGMETDHPDLLVNAAGAPHQDFFTSTGSGAHKSTGNAHGTCVAGLIAAQSGSSRGVVGVAPQARLASWVVFNASGTFLTEPQSRRMFQYASNVVSVQNHSWGNADPEFLPLGTLESQGIQNAVTHGRNGLGVVLVRAAGNERLELNNVNDDGYANDIRTITVGAVRANGQVTSYSTPGACVLVSAFSADDRVLMGTGIYTNYPTLTTTDRRGSLGYNVSTLNNPDYAFDTSGFDGTSGSTPQISGLCALILAANPALSYRDVQQILILSARTLHPADPVLITNQAGLRFSPNTGFGVPDAAEALRLATAWKPRPAREETTATSRSSPAIPDDGLRLRVSGPRLPASLASVPAWPSDGLYVDDPLGPLPVVDVGLALTPILQDLTGAAALVRRGQNDFVQKIRHAAAAGARVVIMYNNEGTTTRHFIQGADVHFLPIPTLFIDQTAGAALSNYLQTTPSATVQIAPEAAVVTLPVSASLLCEHVTLRVRTTHQRRADLRITLVSPAGTRSVLQHFNQDTLSPLPDWTYSSVVHFFEQAAGNWRVEVTDQRSGVGGSLTALDLTLTGVPIMDVDRDGLDDAWELQALGGLDPGPADDEDRDGASNLREYLLGTDPRGDGPSLEIEMTPWDARFWRLCWPTTPYAGYRLEAAASTAGPFLLVEALESPFATAEVLVPAGIEPLRFFRVGAIEVR